MLKSVLYYLLFATTAIRLTDLVILMAGGGTNLPAAVLVVAGAMVVYGAALLIKKLFGALRIKELMTFYLVQLSLVGFNLVYIALTYPLQLSFLEIVAVGSFLDILLDVCVVYYCVKRMRTSFVPVVAKGEPVKEVA